MSLPIRKSQADLKPSSTISPLSSLAKSSIATALLIGLTVGLVVLTSKSGFLGHHQSADNLSNSQQQERASSFAMLTALPLTFVSPKEVPAAIESMGLATDAKQALLTDFGLSKQSTLPAPNAVTEIVPRKSKPIRLAWITLWDTDTEDGDAVRIDSQGYSRVVVLTKQPVTFAIPIPISGNVNITGMKDGEGGGITVGLASGVSKVVFPIMSVGQVLSLKVKVD